MSWLLRLAVPIAFVLLLLPAGGGATTTPYDPFFATQATVADFGAATRPFGVAAGDFDGDGKADLVVGRTTGNVAFVKGAGDGTFAAPVVFAWKQAFFNAWAFAAADVNADGNLDVVWGANAASSGCSVSPVPATGCPSTVTVDDGDVRVFYGNGDGTFAETTYFVSGVRHNAGVRLADVGTDAGSLAVGDLDGDSDADVVAGAIDGANTVVKLLRNGGGGSFAVETLISQATTCATPCAPIYFPAISTQNSPWGLAFGDANNDGDLDLWVGDRALYVYRYDNDGSGAFTLQPGNVIAGRPNVYLGHDAFRAAVGFTASLGSADLNGDSKADLVLGLHSGTQTPASGTPNDGAVLLDVSTAGGHKGFGPLADVGTMARGVTLADVNADGHRDVLAAEYDGKVKLLRQLPPLDSDGDNVSDYVDNAPEIPNAARLDMNVDAAVNHRDQLDNDFDTVLGNPEDPATWQRLGDPADTDDDNDGVSDGEDNCVFVANPGQADVDADGIGDGCDPLDGRDPDGDGVATGPLPGEAGYALAHAAAVKWSQGATKFVLRNDALSRFFQNEFTQLLTDATVLSPAEWAQRCWENYGPEDGSYEPCGDAATQTLTLPGGKEVPMSLVVIPKQIWTDPPVVAWINDRNANPRLEIGQHGTYHADNVPFSDWAGDPARNWVSCETCGLSEAENFELLNVGHDTLLGNYANKWVAESGALPGSPKIDWSDASHPLISYAAPFNASDETSRKAMGQLGFRAFSASRFEEDGSTSYGSIFTPGGVNKHETTDEWGMFHASADVQLDPPDDLIADGDYSADDRAAYEAYLESQVNAGGLTTWLIEEVEWSGRACNDKERLVDCNGQPNREDNTVYLPRWEAWLHLLDFVKAYPDGVAMTLGEVALAKGYDNAPTVPNGGQADSDHDGIGDAIDGATLAAAAATLSRNVPGTLSATLENAAGDPLAGQQVTFGFDADGDSTNETYVGTTDSAGVATVTVTATRPVGSAAFTVEWDGLRATAADGAALAIVDTTTLSLDAANPSSGQVTDAVTVAATLVDSDGAPLGGYTVAFSIGSASAAGTTGADGRASAVLTLVEPGGPATLQASFAGDGPYGSSSAEAPFTVLAEDTTLALADAVAFRSNPAVARATLREADGAAVPGRSVEFFVEEKVKGVFVWTSLGTDTTNAVGVAEMTVPMRYSTAEKRRIRAVFGGDASYIGATGNAFTYR